MWDNAGCGLASYGGSLARMQSKVMVSHTCVVFDFMLTALLLLLLLLDLQSVLAGEKLAPALLDLTSSKRAAGAEEGGEVAAAPALDEQ